MTLRPFLLFVPAALVLAVALSACPRPDEPDGCTGLVAGDLVITEYMNNPDGTDSGKEYFEVYNATGKAIPLRGVSLFLAKSDGSSPKSHVVTTGEVPAGGYFVFGDAPEASKPTYVNYSYGENLGGSGMANSTGLIGIKCGAAVVDEVAYTSGGASGHARSLDGKLVPDSAANDLEDNWCDAITSLVGKDFGTPGEENDACASSANCIGAGGASREVVGPKEGELIITEFMADPQAISEETGEWMELYATADVDLNGVTVSAGTSKTTLTSNDCLAVKAGSYVVLAKTEDPSQNGGLPAPLALFTFDLTNSPSSPVELAVKKGETVVDRVWYAGATEGSSAQLDPRFLDAQSNDNSLTFCDGQTPWGSGTQNGTPGEPNAECPTAPDVTKCAEGGVERDTVRPALGDLVITELMPKPIGSADRQAWFEIYSKSAIDLNGLEISNGSAKLIIAPRECLKVEAESHVVFARSALAYENGGLPSVDATFTFALPTGGGTLSVSQDLTVLDSVSYLAPLTGQSVALDPERLDHLLNDDPVSFCPGTNVYGNAGNKGTPGAANLACPPIVDPSKCSEGGVQRDSVPPTVGSLVITEIMASPSGNDSLQEWFEVYVKADADLNGLVLSNGTSSAASRTTISSESCLPVTAGDYLVFGRATDPTVNGWIYEMAGIFGFSLPTSGSVVLKHGVDTIDYALYADAPDGEALQLDGASLDADANDVPHAFCKATDPYGATSNLGTPGLANGICPPYIDPDHCTDTGQSTARGVIKPAVGDLVISEVMSAPTGIQSNKEWVEVYFKRDVDLNGVELVVGSTGTARYKVLSTSCIRPGAGGYAVLARSADPTLNGGLPEVAATFDSDLPSSGSTPISLVRDSQLIDAVTYPAISGSGYSQQLASTKLDATQNNASEAWCKAEASATYGTGTDHGTPGADNGSCATVNPNECTDPGTGTLRPIVAPAVGDLVLSEYLADPSSTAADDSLGEWVEVFVKTDVDLNGVQLGINSSKYPLVTGETCVRPGLGQYVVLARSSDSSVNGGVTGVLATFSSGLTNSGGQTLSLSRDAQTLDTATTLSSTAGVSKQLSGYALDVTLNDVASNWCNTASGTTFGKGDRGTPGTANATCAAP